MPSLIKDSTVTLLARLITFVISLTTSIVIARLLGPSLKGSYSIIALTMSLASLMMLFGLGSANVYFGARHPEQLPVLAGNSLIAALGFGLIGAAIVESLTFVPQVQTYFTESGVPILWIRLIVLLLPVLLLNSYLPEILRARGDLWKYNILAVWHNVSAFVAVVLLVAVWQYQLVGAVVAWALALISSVTVAFWFVGQVNNWRIQVNRSILRRSVHFGLRLHPGNFAQFLNYRLDVFLVAFYLSPIEVGYYTIASGLAEKLWEFPHAIRTVLMHRVSSSQSVDGALATTARVSRIVLAAIGVLCGAIALVSYPLILTMYGAEYLPAVPALILLLPGIWVLGVAKLLAVHLAGTGRPEVGTLGALTSLLVTVGLDLFLIPRFGIQGAAIASSVAYSVSALVISLIFLRITGCKGTDVVVIQRKDMEALRSAFYSLLHQVRAPRQAS